MQETENSFVRLWLSLLSMGAQSPNEALQLDPSDTASPISLVITGASACTLEVTVGVLFKVMAVLPFVYRPR
jgi:hypothetical protein